MRENIKKLHTLQNCHYIVSRCFNYFVLAWIESKMNFVFAVFNVKLYSKELLLGNVLTLRRYEIAVVQDCSSADMLQQKNS